VICGISVGFRGGVRENLEIYLAVESHSNVAKGATLEWGTRHSKHFDHRKRGIMKIAGIFITLMALAGMVFGQSPTKVTGDPVKTASGLEYWDIKVGTGAVAEAGHKVRVDYTGWLTDGTKFDSSVGTGRPFEFMLGAGQVIKGWDQGVAG
jgi:hypothetical protein